VVAAEKERGRGRREGEGYLFEGCSLPSA